MKKITPKNTKSTKRGFFSVFLWAFCVLCGLFFSLTARAQINSVFTVPPYKLNETIEYIEEWELVNKEPHPVHTDPMKAVVIESPIPHAAQSTTLHLGTLLKNNTPLEAQGGTFVVETQFAVACNPRYHFGGGLYFRFGTTDERSPFYFGFDYDEGGGLYYQGQGEKVIVLSRADLPENAAYKFTIHFNMDAQTFRVLVTSPEDKSFRHESQDIPFQEKFMENNPSGKLGRLHMGNNKPTVMDAYIDYVKVTPSLE